MSVALETSRPLTVRTVPVGDPGDLLARLPEVRAYAWLREGEGLVGWGEAARISVPPGPGRFARARDAIVALFAAAHVDDPLALPGSGIVAFGGFTFDAASAGSAFVVPRVVMAKRGGRAWLTVIGEDPFEMVTPLREPGQVSWEDGPFGPYEYTTAVARAVEMIKAGRLDKVVLARDMHAVAPDAIDTRVLLHRLAARYPQCYTFSCDGLVGATPELLIRRTGPAIESLVLAGTAARGQDPEDDAARVAALLASAKDRHEHACAADSVREALAPLCAELSVPETPDLLRLANVTHLATPIHGRLADGASVLDTVAALHPTAAVGGTPTAAAVRVIRELEGMDRGRYAGPVGWIDARGDGEWGIALRCAEVTGRRARLFAGCGIMAASDPEAELAEAQAKLRVMQYAVDGV